MLPRARVLACCSMDEAGHLKASEFSPHGAWRVGAALSRQLQSTRPLGCQRSVIPHLDESAIHKLEARTRVIKSQKRPGSAIQWVEAHEACSFQVARTLFWDDEGRQVALAARDDPAPERLRPAKRQVRAFQRITQQGRPRGAGSTR